MAISPQCLKILEKVSFNIASEASYVHILNGQKCIKNVKNGQFWRVFENLKQFQIHFYFSKLVFKVKRNWLIAKVKVAFVNNFHYSFRLCFV